MPEAYQGETTEPLGECRARPPAFVPEIFARQAAPAHFDRTSAEDERDIYEATRFPITDEADWCAEFEKRVVLQ